MSILLTRPSGMALQDWADQIVLDLDLFGSFSKLEGDDWQTWATQFLNNAVIGANPPMPQQFDAWDDWAERFVGSLS